MYNKFTTNVFDAMIDTLNEKADESVGNHYVLLLNDIAWRQAQHALGKYLQNAKTDGAHLWSKKANGGVGGYVKVGATYNEYEFGGNFVTIRVERALSREYPTKGFGMAIDLTADSTKNMPAVKWYNWDSWLLVA